MRELKFELGGLFMDMLINGVDWVVFIENATAIYQVMQRTLGSAHGGRQQIKGDRRLYFLQCVVICYCMKF